MTANPWICSHLQLLLLLVGGAPSLGKLIIWYSLFRILSCDLLCL